jgi:hypothetical protein
MLRAIARTSLSSCWRRNGTLRAVTDLLHPSDQADAILARRATTLSISSDVVSVPKLKRMAPMPIRSGTLIAARTGESSIRPEWHAEPVDAATPLICTSMSAPILPTNETLWVLGKRCVAWPLSTTRSPNLSCSARQKRSRRASTRFIRIRSCANTQAAPRPTASSARAGPARGPHRGSTAPV